MFTTSTYPLDVYAVNTASRNEDGRLKGRPSSHSTRVAQGTRVNRIFRTRPVLMSSPVMRLLGRRVNSTIARPRNVPPYAGSTVNGSVTPVRKRSAVSAADTE